MKRLFTLGLIAGTLTFTLLTTLLTLSHLNQRAALESAAQADARVQSQQAADQIGDAFAEVMRIAERMARDLSFGELAFTDIADRLDTEISIRPDIDGLAVTFAPFAYDPDTRLYQRYVYKTADDGFDVLDGATYDYTLPHDDDPDTPDTRWYVDTVAQGARWMEPFFAAGAGKVLVEYGVPFTFPGRDRANETAGIVTIDYSLDDLRALMAALDLGATGYGFVLTAQGTLLAHPVAEYVARSSFFDLQIDPDLQTAARAVLDTAEAQFAVGLDPVTNEGVWAFFEPIGSTGWAVGIVLNQSEFAPVPRQTLREQTGIALAAAGLLFFGLSTVFRLDRYVITGLWASSQLFAVLSLGLIVTVWTLNARLPDHSGVRITSLTQVERYLESQVVDPDAPPAHLSTGVYVQALDFPDPTSVTLNGYVWQRRPVDSDTLTSDVPFGFTMPQLSGEEFTLEEISREIDGNSETVLWYIGVTLRQVYDTGRFPFDHRDITLRLTPADPAANIVLTPDLRGYPFITPSLLPGVDSQVQINNWTLSSSRFSYNDAAPAPTDFGLATRAALVSGPELRFTIRAERSTLGPFIAYLLPGTIAAVMMFTYLLSRREPGKDEEVVNALNYAAAIFFVVAVIHTGLRDQIAAVGVTYLEYIYLLLYVAIVAVAANIYVVARFPHWGIVSFRENILPKLLYWPVFIGVLLIVTLLTFVY